MWTVVAHSAGVTVDKPGQVYGVWGREGERGQGGGMNPEIELEMPGPCFVPVFSEFGLLAVYLTSLVYNWNLSPCRGFLCLFF